MARSPRREDGPERVEVIDAGEPQDGVLPDVSREPTVVADATHRNPAPPREAATARFFRVVRGGYFTAPGGAGRSQLREGKIIDDLNYPVASLQQQGIRLEEIAAHERDSY